jgi:PAS domain-containing protein
MEAIYIHGTDGKHIIANHAWLGTFGYERADLAHVNAVDFYAKPAKDRQWLRPADD